MSANSVEAAEAGTEGAEVTRLKRKAPKSSFWARRRSARHHRGGGGPIAAIGGVVGGVVGGVFGRR